MSPSKTINSIVKCFSFAPSESCIIYFALSNAALTDCNVQSSWYANTRSYTFFLDSLHRCMSLCLGSTSTYVQLQVAASKASSTSITWN
jgi:hypothetical protein